MLVHGGVTIGAATWDVPRSLGEHWHLVVRRGYFPNPPVEVEDFEVGVGDLAEVLTEPMRPVGHACGGVVALPAAWWGARVVAGPPRGVDVRGGSGGR